MTWNVRIPKKGRKNWLVIKRFITNHWIRKASSSSFSSSFSFILCFNTMSGYLSFYGPHIGTMIQLIVQGASPKKTQKAKRHWNTETPSLHIPWNNSPLFYESHCRARAWTKDFLISRLRHCHWTKRPDLNRKVATLYWNLLIIYLIISYRNNPFGSRVYQWTTGLKFTYFSWRMTF